MSESRILVVDGDMSRAERVATLLEFMDFNPRLVADAADLDPGATNTITYSALSYDVGGAKPSADGCGGGILLSNSLAFYAA